MVDDPRDALECFGSAPVDLLALGPFLVRRPGSAAAAAAEAVGAGVPA
jgi:carbamoyltransferase